MKKYPSIEQFRNVVRAVRLNHDYQGKDSEGNPIYNHISPYPILKFTGTVKLHGTNAAVVKYKDRIEYQSRENVLSLLKDNAGFCRNMMAKNLDFLFKDCYSKDKDLQFENHIAIFGEWCGGSIQKGVAINGLPNMFVIFGVKVDDVWQDVDYIFSDPVQNIYNIRDFKTFTIDIDFNEPEMIQNKLVELTIEVETECPVGKAFGISGIGEGIVWEHGGYQFKTKGEKHSASKVKTIATVDIEMIENIKEMVDYTVTENRLEQGIQKLKEANIEIDMKATGEFLRWVITDIIKEETDTIVKNNIDPKKLNSACSNKARLWYINYINTNY